MKHYGNKKEAHPAQGFEASPQFSVQESKAGNLDDVFNGGFPPHPPHSPHALPHHASQLLLHHVQLKMPSAILASGHGNRRSEKWSVSAGLGRVLPHSQSSIFSGKRKSVSEQKCKPLASLHKQVRTFKNKNTLERRNALKVSIFLPLNIPPSV